MRAAPTDETGLVVAAQAGDRRALDELVATSLPLVHSLVGRALDGDPDADDVVQETLLRAVGQLPTLQAPESFRAWLSAIAVRQVGTHLRRRAVTSRRTTSVDEAVGLPDPDAEFEDLTMLQLELSGQRRDVARAARWLDPADRVLLSLWWLELAGELTRPELAAALGVGIAHAGVRVQRMRQQLDLSRELLAALEARPRCAALETVLLDWDGTPGPLWRKRIARHTRSCPVCGRCAGDMIAVERLLEGFALLPVPAALLAAVLGRLSPAAVAGKVAGAAKAGFFGQLLQAAVAHPLVAAVTAGAAVAGSAVTAVRGGPGGLSPRSPGAGPTAGPAPATTALATTAPATAASATTGPAGQPGSFAAGEPASLESADEPGMFVTAVASLGFLTRVGPGSAEAVRRQATFMVVAGLADAGCFSFRAPDGRYLRHASWRLRVNPNERTPLFRSDATFCVRAGPTAGTVVLESSNYPGWYLHRRGDELWVDHADGSAAFETASSFRIRGALAN
jgi:RNA polymerase sigma factor (sigma-70 family)